MRNSLILLFIIYSFSLVAQVSVSQLDASSKDLQKAWVDSTYSSLSLKEKIGQLYIVQVFSNQDDTTMKSILNQIKKNHIGGLIYSQGGPVRQVLLNNKLQAASKVPLLIGMDA